MEWVTGLTLIGISIGVLFISLFILEISIDHTKTNIQPLMMWIRMFLVILGLTFGGLLILYQMIGE